MKAWDKWVKLSYLKPKALTGKKGEVSVMFQQDMQGYYKILLLHSAFIVLFQC